MSTEDHIDFADLEDNEVQHETNVEDEQNNMPPQFDQQEKDADPPETCPTDQVNPAGIVEEEVNDDGTRSEAAQSECVHPTSELGQMIIQDNLTPAILDFWNHPDQRDDFKLASEFFSTFMKRPFLQSIREREQSVRFEKICQEHINKERQMVNERDELVTLQNEEINQLKRKTDEMEKKFNYIRQASSEKEVKLGEEREKTQVVVRRLIDLFDSDFEVEKQRHEEKKRRLLAIIDSEVEVSCK